MPAKNAQSLNAAVTRPARSAVDVIGPSRRPPLVFVTDPGRLNVRCTYDFALSPSNRAKLKFAEFPPLLTDRSRIGTVLESLDAWSNNVDYRGTNTNSLGDFKPAQITQLLASYKVDWQGAIKEYFNTIHSWFSLVHRERFESCFLSPAACNGGSENSILGSVISDTAKIEDPPVASADAALLLVCLYLITQIASSRRPSTQIFCPLYRTIKRVFALSKCLTDPTIELMQCGAFITLFEYGHGDSISAYRTLSETVALARVFDLRPGKYRQGEEKVDVSPEEKECRAIWWGLFILDQ